MLKLLRLNILILFLFPLMARANIVGNDLQNSNPTGNGLDFVTVHSSDTLQPFQFNLGAFLTYATNSLPYFTLPGAPTSGQEFFEPNDNLTASNLHLAVGLMEGWDIAAHANFILGQSIDNSAFLGTFAKKGLIDLRVSSKIRLYKGNSSGLAFVGSVDIDRVVNNPYVGDNPGPTINFELAYDKLITNWIRWGLNLGYRLRNEGTAIPNTGVTPIEDQITYSTAVSFMMSDKFAIMGELFGSSPTAESSTPTDRQEGNLQTLGGVRYKFDGEFDIHGGVGTEVYHGLGTPDILVYAGVNWRFGGKKDEPPPPRPTPIVEEIPDTDGDGVYDDKDQCPGTPPNTEVNDLGCAKKKMENITLDNLNFITGTARLNPGQEAKVKKMVDTIRERLDDIDKIIVEGHTDSVGNEDYNMRLSQDRAATIAKLLVDRVPMPSDKVIPMGKGETSPVDSNETKAGRANNRRVELRVVHLSDQTEAPKTELPEKTQ